MKYTVTAMTMTTMNIIRRDQIAFLAGVPIR